MENEFIIKEFGNRIKYLRQQSKVSQEQLAFKTGFHRTYIGMIERGERNISLSNITVFAKAFNLTIDQLLKFNHSDDLFKLYKLKSEE